MSWKSVSSRGGCRRLRRQAGNGLVFALLGLLVSALAAAAAMRAGELQVRHDAGSAEATILDTLRNAANNAIFEQLVALQNGQPIAKGDVTVAPVTENGQAVWKPAVQDLVGMGYLPAGWTAVASTLNQAPYLVSFTRVPAGCNPSSCSIEGHVILAGPLRGGSSVMDGSLIGPILTRLGADAGVSLPNRPDVVTGLGDTWQTPNPVGGQPPGVVGVRIGTAGSTFGQFVRIADTRDPDLSGNLTVAGNTVFGNGATTSVFNSTVDVLGGVTASGGVTSGDGFHTASIDAFGSGDAGAIVLKSGDLAVRNASGDALLRIFANGDVAALRDFNAGGSVRAQGLTLTGSVNEGDPCRPGQVAMLAMGGLATCQGSTFKAVGRYAAFGSPCAVDGQGAVDPDSGDTLICRHGYFASLSRLLSPRVYMASFSVTHGTIIPVSAALPQGCPATGGPTTSQAALYLMPQTDAGTPGNTVLNRDATWDGSAWTISLTDGAGVPTASLAIAEIFCVYP